MNNNGFVKTMYDMCNINNTPVLLQYEKSWIGGIQTISIDPELFKAYEECNLLLSELKRNWSAPYNFYALYHFAEFIKIAEKIFFYKNDMSAPLACDSKLSDSKKILVSQLSNGTIVVTLSRQDEHNNITIDIKHNYGRQMEYRYCKNDDLFEDLKNKSDEILIKTSYDYLKNIMMQFYSFIISTIANGDINKLIAGEISFNIDFEDKQPDLHINAIDDLSEDDKDFMRWFILQPEDKTKKALIENKPIYYTSNNPWRLYK